jgi:hypothetical protein
VTVNDPSPKPRPKLPQAGVPHAGLTRGILAGGLFALVAWPLCACGGAEPRQPVTGGDAADTLEGAEAELTRLEALVDGGFLGTVRPDSAGDPVPVPPPTAAEPAPLVKKGEPASQCENACSALASMSRSADRICQLAGPGDRCEAAKSRVAGATTRVTARCSECES